jgi:hypothetical protein
MNLKLNSINIRRGLTIEGSEFESRWLQEFSLLHILQTGSEAHPASQPSISGYRVLSPRG